MARKCSVPAGVCVTRMVVVSRAGVRNCRKPSAATNSSSSASRRARWGRCPRLARCSATVRSLRSWPTSGGSMTKAFAKPRGRIVGYAASISLLVLGSAAADARSLETIIERGALTLCANPNALPFASKTGPVPGFQIELGEQIARELGVKLTREWVVRAIQYRRADCDLVLDTIARKDAPPEGGVKVTRPYHRSGVVLAVRADSHATSLTSLGSDQRVGVPGGSLVSMMLDKGGTVTSPFVVEDEIVAALANREIEAAAVTPGTVGWCNH